MPHAVKGEVAWIFCIVKPGEKRKDERVTDPGDLSSLENPESLDAIGEAIA